MNIRPEHIDSLRHLGYTDTEASFLYLVATHSGYLTQRQFLAFAQVQKGGLASRLIAKALGRKHLRAAQGAYNTHVYNLYSRRLYGAVDRENLRKRRRPPRNLFRLDFSFSTLFSPTLTSATSKRRPKKSPIFRTAWALSFRACQAASTRASGPIPSANATSLIASRSYCPVPITSSLFLLW